MNASPPPRPADDPDRRPFAADAPTEFPPADAPPAYVGPEQTVADAAGLGPFGPYWIPPGIDLTGWSPAQIGHVAAIINPIYNDLVWHATTALAKSTGLTVVHLLWLEMLDQMELSTVQDNDGDVLHIALREFGNRSRRQIIDRHLRTVQAKMKASDLLLRLKDFKRKCRAQASKDAGDYDPDFYRSMKRAPGWKP